MNTTTTSRIDPLRLASVVVLLAALVGAGCGGGPFGDEAAVGRVIDAIVEEAPEARSALVRETDAAIGPVEVHVDLSLSVQPYLAAGAESTLRRVLVALSDDLGGDVRFHGFGFERDSTRQTVTPLAVGALLAQPAYTRVNNDYGDLFARFHADSTGALGPVRIVLTDGVESDREGGAMFGRVVEGADAWIRSGGAFAALVWRAPYSGTYFSESAACPGGAFAMACPDRPLLGFVFAPTPGHLRALVQTLGDGLRPDHIVRVGTRDGHLEIIAPEPSAPGRRARPLLRNEVRHVAAGYEPVTVGSLAAAQHRLPSGYVPLRFRLTPAADEEPWRSLAPDDRRAFLESLRPQVRAWAVRSRRDSTWLEAFEPDIFQPTVAADSAGTLVVTVPVRKPTLKGVRHFAWLVSLVPYQTATRLVPAGLSTPDDCSPEACNQTLNLAQLLGAIVRDDYAPARTVLLTEWR